MLFEYFHHYTAIPLWGKHVLSYDGGQDYSPHIWITVKGRGQKPRGQKPHGQKPQRIKAPTDKSTGGQNPQRIKAPRDALCYCHLFMSRRSVECQLKLFPPLICFVCLPRTVGGHYKILFMKFILNANHT